MVHTPSSEQQVLSDMGLTASMRRSLRLVGNEASSLLDVELSKLTSVSFHTNKDHDITNIHSERVVFLGVLHACASIYIGSLSPLLQRAADLQAEDLLLDLHQLTPQSVFLSQDAGNHGLGLISGQVCLEDGDSLQLHTIIIITL